MDENSATCEDSYPENVIAQRRKRQKAERTIGTVLQWLPQHRAATLHSLTGEYLAEVL